MKYILRTIKTVSGNDALYKEMKKGVPVYWAKAETGQVKAVSKDWVLQNIDKIKNASADKNGRIFPIEIKNAPIALTRIEADIVACLGTISMDNFRGILYRVLEKVENSKGKEMIYAATYCLTKNDRELEKIAKKCYNPPYAQYILRKLSEIEECMLLSTIMGKTLKEIEKYHWSTFITILGEDLDKKFENEPKDFMKQKTTKEEAIKYFCGYLEENDVSEFDTSELDAIAAEMKEEYGEEVMADIIAFINNVIADIQGLQHRVEYNLGKVFSFVGFGIEDVQILMDERKKKHLIQ